MKLATAYAVNTCVLPCHASPYSLLTHDSFLIATCTYRFPITAYHVRPTTKGASSPSSRASFKHTAPTTSRPTPARKVKP
eukprot:scaffold19531_cov42-Phaeocystis_antarctica.AAC.4